MKEHGKINAEVISVNAEKVRIMVNDLDDWKTAEQKLKIGSYLEIADTNDFIVIAVIENFKIEMIELKVKDSDGNEEIKVERKYILEAMPLGTIRDGIFTRGGDTLSIPPTSVNIAKDEIIDKIFTDSIRSGERFSFSRLSNNENVIVNVNGNKFFNKHIAIVGSSGSGKSHTIAKIIQNATKIKENNFEGLNNSHIIIFDIHSEYDSAFENANKINVENLLLPYWLLNGEELEELFLDTGDNNNYNQSSLLRNLITYNKRSHNGDNIDIDFDTPLKFNVKEIYKSLKNLKIEAHDYSNDLIIKYENEDKEFDTSYEKYKDYFKDIYKFKTTKPNQIKKGPYADGTIDKFINRFYNKINDNRLSFLLSEKLMNISFEDVLRQFMGYQQNKESNVTIIDLSGVPFEVLSITVSLISRILFDFTYYYKKKISNNNVPLLLVFEEAHKYVPKSDLAKYKSSKLSIERIAKEGRKYGITLAIVSQRPSEVSETIFSQCNTFISMRLTNPDDQNYVKKLLPDTLGTLTSVLSTLPAGNALLIGESVIMPSIVTIDRCNPEPSSNDVMYIDEWNKRWYSIDFNKIIENWNK